MFGPPKDVEGQCNAHLYIADDHGDNRATMCCQLPKGHEGTHEEVFYREGREVRIYWNGDERPVEEDERRRSEKRSERTRARWRKEAEEWRAAEDPRE